MFDQRIQVLVSAEQRRRLEAEARKRGSSVGSLIREAVDARYGSVTREMRIRAAEWFRRGHPGKFLSIEEMHEIIGEERLANFPELTKRRKK